MQLSAPPTGASDQNPAFSPDGRTILFTRFSNGYNEGPAELMLLDSATGQVALFITAPDSDNVNMPGTSWNLATNRIAFSSDREDTDEIWTADLDGGGLLRISHTTDGFALEPTFSPDGEWIVFETHDDLPEDQQMGRIWKVRADGSYLTPLTSGEYDDRQPNWSPTGERILFQRREPGSDNWDIVTIAPDGSDLRPVTTQPAEDTDASWSPDGRWIVYSSDYDDVDIANLFIIAAQGGELVRVTFNENGYDGAPSWSPDGAWIAFESGGDEAPTALWMIAVPPLP
jgi:TolB protein